MADDLWPAAEDANVPKFLDAGMFESASERLLRQEFERLHGWNAAMLANFEPQFTDVETEISLLTGMPELEALDPQLAEMHRNGMLQELGLAYRHLEAGDPACIFQQVYKYGEIQQIRLHRREDGSEIFLATHISGDAEGNQVDAMYLMSADRALEYRNRLQATIEATIVDQHLARELGLDMKFLEHAELSLQEKQAMWAAYQSIQAMEVVGIDHTELNVTRQKLVRLLLPGTRLLDGIRGDTWIQATAEYTKQIRAVIGQHELYGQSAEELLQRERLLRLAALNKQLQRRQAATTAGLLAASALVSISGGLMVEAIDHTASRQLRSLTIGGIVGVLSYMRSSWAVSKRMLGISGFGTIAEKDDAQAARPARNSTTRHSSNILREQLNRERATAAAYIRELHW